MKQGLNPYLPSYEYVPDGEPHVFGDRLYIFGSHDHFGGKEYCENDYVCWSASVENVKEWKYEGVIYKREQDPLYEGPQNHMFAPDVQQGTDGRYYLYYGMDFVNRIAIAVCDTPSGKYEYYGEVQYKDGTRFGGREKELLRFDPAVLADDDGRIWLYCGFSPKIPYFQQLAEKTGITIEAMENQVAELDSDMKAIKTEAIPLIPGYDNGKGTGFEGHEFYEASSIRKFKGKYYFIYSSFLSHELAYAISDEPNCGFIYGGPLHSNGNIGYKGNKKTQYYWGNNHGSVVEVKDKYYVFAHRQTNSTEHDRQGIAEPIVMDPNGHFEMAEMTSCGLNDGPLSCFETYEAGIACVLYEKTGACKTTDESNWRKKRRAMITQDGADRENSPGQYVANIKNQTVIGYKYFNFENVKEIEVTTKGNASGDLIVSTEPEGEMIATLPIKRSGENVVSTKAVMNVSNGIHALYFRFQGRGKFSLIQFKMQ